MWRSWTSFHTSVWAEGLMGRLERARSALCRRAVDSDSTRFFFLMMSASGTSQLPIHVRGCYRCVSSTFLAHLTLGDIFDGQQNPGRLRRFLLETAGLEDEHFPSKRRELLINHEFLERSVMRQDLLEEFTQP